MKTRRYSELKKLNTFEDRYEYLKLGGVVGESTFGSERYLNQAFYKSSKWMNARNHVILRDEGCDLGVEGYDISDMVVVHHMNPVTIGDIENDSPNLYDQEYLISTTSRTHKAIHYGDASLLPKPPIERTKHDTTPWKARGEENVK